MSLTRCPMVLLVLAALACTRDAAAVDCAARRVNDLDYVVCRVDIRKERLAIAYADSKGRRFESFESLRAGLAREQRKLVFAMNAGMFHADFRPVGLLVIDGATLAPINRASGTGNFFLQPNGVFLVDGDARILATDQFREQQPRFATQSGPMLVHLGQIPASFAFRADSASRKTRNGVCVPQPGIAAFAISDSPVNFHEFAEFFRATLGCNEALYLDGTISSLYAPQLQRADRHSKLGPMFAVAE